MLFRGIVTSALGLACLAMMPSTERTECQPLDNNLTAGEVSDIPDALDLNELARKDPVGFLKRCREKSRDHVLGYRGTLVKRERIDGVLHPTETIDLTLREMPYAVLLIWRDGARKVLGTPVEGTLYVSGLNAGKMLVWRPQARVNFMKLIDILPGDASARAASRYAISEAGLSHAIERSIMAWSQAERSGTLDVEYLGVRSISKLDGQHCHVFERRCHSPESDPFLMSEVDSVEEANKSGRFSKIELMISVDHLLQVGTKLTDDSGHLIGEYYFKKLVINPPFPGDQFNQSQFK